MFCCISNCVPRDPVVSRASGCLFERSLVEAHIASHGTCPVTGEPLRSEDLIAVRRGALTPTHTHTHMNTAASASSSSLCFASASETVPGLLERLHAQWDAAMLEQYAMRQRLAQTQQELAHALHQYEAACRVIATFVRDRDGGQGQEEEEEEEEEEEPKGNKDKNKDKNRDKGSGVVPDAVLRRIEAHDAAQRAARRVRAEPKRILSAAAFSPQCATTAATKATTTTATATTAIAAVGGPACAVAWGSDGAIVVGLLSGGVALATAATNNHSSTAVDSTTTTTTTTHSTSTSSSAVDCSWRVAVSAGHALAARHIALCGADGAVSGGDDGALRLWTTHSNNNNNNNNEEEEGEGGGGGNAMSGPVLVCRSVVRPHGCAVAGVAPVTAAVVLSASARAVALCDLARGEVIATVPAADEGIAGDIACLATHPYGTIAALGAGGTGGNNNIHNHNTNALCVWDVRQMCADTHVAVPGGASVASVAFAGDCFTLATGLQSGVVTLWDLRKMSAPLADMQWGMGAVPLVAFDASGKYLAVSGGNGSGGGSGGGIVRLFDWAAAPNEPLCALSGHREAVTGVCWGTDARAVASCSLDGTIRVYSIA